ncbi:MAG TPA: hypothetical protein VM031_02595 [Phycisphaerae bacterium]|nr:hypothetical protein [Phycisphaerae bacterium]
MTWSKASRSVAIICALLFVGRWLVAVGAAPKAARGPENLAPKAKITSNSEFSGDFQAKFVADGHIAGIATRDDTRHAWAVQGKTHRNGAELRFEWPKPVRVAEVVYYGRTASAVECWKGYQVLVDGSAKPVAAGELKSGYGPQRIKLPRPTPARKLTLKFTSSHDGLNPGASEVRIYATSPPEAVVGKFIPLPAFRASAMGPWPTLPPPPPVPDSPELARALRTGKLGFDKLLVIQRHEINPTHVYTYHAEGFRPGGGLWVLSLADGKLTQLVAATTGEIIHCDASYDGREILFSWKKSGRNQNTHAPLNPEKEKTYQVYRVGADGTGLKQLTDGQANNFNACWLPDGGIAFLSDRKPAFAYCWTTTSPILHRMDRDGSNVQRISSSYLNDFTPSVLDDGRIVYSRWEYIDRPACPIQSLWTMNPDGTGVAGLFGNRVLDPGTFMEARSIPGTGKVLCVLTSHNGPCRGGIGVLDYDLSANGQASIRNVTPEVDVRRVDAGTGNGVHGPYESPYPLSEKYFLVSRRGTVLLRDYDRSEQVTLLSPRGGMGFYGPQPLGARSRPPVRPTSLPEKAEPWATVLLQDVYHGLEPYVKRGEVKEICVVQEIEKSRRVPLCNGVPTGKGWAANSAFGYQFPLVSCGATYAPKRIWGYVPVEADGSAHFRVPSGLPIYFLAIDAEGQAIQRMRTFTHFMPGEVHSCTGCHAERNYAPPRPLRRPTAAQNPPRPLEEPEWGRREGFSYWQIVQPVLDKHCIKCHNARTAPKGVDLTGDRSDFFSVSYDVLTRTGTQWAWRPEVHGAGQPVGPYVRWISSANGSEQNVLDIAPRRWGSPASKLVQQTLAGHGDKQGKPRVKLDRRELRRIMAWVDLNIPYYGTSRSNYPRRMGCRRLLPPDLDGVLQAVARRRCASCHDKDARGRVKVPRTFYTRITRPEDNNFLLAPLAKSAGGTQRCGKAVFASKDDPDYRAILKTFEPIGRMLKDKPRMDMPGAAVVAGCAPADAK